MTKPFLAAFFITISSCVFALPIDYKEPQKSTKQIETTKKQPEFMKFSKRANSYWMRNQIKNNPGYWSNPQMGCRRGFYTFYHDNLTKVFCSKSTVEYN